MSSFSSVYAFTYLRLLRKEYCIVSHSTCAKNPANGLMCILILVWSYIYHSHVHKLFIAINGEMHSLEAGMKISPKHEI